MATDKPVTLATAGTAKSRCPVCGAPTDRRHRPFCSRRCADIDLGRWLGEVYAVPKVELDEGDEDLLQSLQSDGTDPQNR